MVCYHQNLGLIAFRPTLPLLLRMEEPVKPRDMPGHLHVHFVRDMVDVEAFNSSAMLMVILL